MDLPLLQAPTMIRFCCTLLFMVVMVPARSQTLHAILVSDVEDREFGMVSQQDEERIMQMLKTTSSYTGLTLSPIYLNRARFTALAVREALDALPVRPKDIVFFYYTGPGTYPESTSKFPTFSLKENVGQRMRSGFNQNSTLSLDQVGDILQKKGARLNIALADCRNSADAFPSLLSMPRVDEDVRNVYLKKLFLGSCGLVKVASAANRQKAWAELGGGSMYTKYFFLTFQGQLAGGFRSARQATWPQFLAPINPLYLKNENDISFQQESVYEIILGTAAQQRLTTRYPTYAYSMGAGEMIEKFRYYLRDKDNFEGLKSEISKAFVRDAPILLVRQNRYPASDARSKKIVDQMTISAYLEHVKEKVHEIREIEVDFTSIRRTPNYEHLKSLTFVEIGDDF